MHPYHLEDLAAVRQAEWLHEAELDRLAASVTRDHPKRSGLRANAGRMFVRVGMLLSGAREATEVTPVMTMEVGD